MRKLGPLTRRSALGLIACAASVPGAALAEVPKYTWRGQALGGTGTITIADVNSANAKAHALMIRDEIERLESIFSLYRSDSELARLNASGHLANPSHDLVRVLEMSREIHDLSAGAFDVSIQPLWQAITSDGDMSPALALVDGKSVHVSPTEIQLERPGMTLTLNGIAQGFIADRIAALLTEHGLRHALLTVGEVLAVGGDADGSPWQVSLDHGTAVDQRVWLTDAALATSRNVGPHLVNPKTGKTGGEFAAVSVEADEAMLADALSTAFFHMDEAAIPVALRRAGGNAHGSAA